MKALLSLLVLVAACEKDNPYYCEGNPDDNCTLGGDGGTTKCTSSDDCSGGTPACDESDGVCVACTATDIGACDGTTPVCEAESCRACTANSECASGACMPDGSCAAEGTLLYASPTGGATATCAASDKCEIMGALSKVTATKKIIVLDPGMYSVLGTYSTAGDFTILGRGATVSLSGEPTDYEVFKVTAGGKLTVLYATITNGNDTSGHGIGCTGGTLTARFATFRDNDANGINAVNCDVTIDSSTFTGNALGGLSLSGAAEPFAVTNNVIYFNGSASTSTFGGVKIAPFTGTPSGRFEFNTIVDNFAKAAAGNSGGIVCGQTTVPITNSIVAHNLYGTSATATDAQKWGDCPSMTSLVQNDITGLEFVNATTLPYNLKIGATSIAKDMATTASTVTVDFEGDERPQGSAKDIGADEYK